jgi:formylglycine-generating enzyme required for sulfatase activity
VGFGLRSPPRRLTNDLPACGLPFSLPGAMKPLHFLLLGLFALGLIFSLLSRQGKLSVAGGGRSFKVPALDAEMIRIEPGTFNMGSGEVGNAQPTTQVTITKGFWLGKTEVTQAQWQTVMGNNPSNFEGDSLPVEQVSWDDAMEFCRKLTERERAAGRLPVGYVYTLPTEAQWEYACRAGTTGDYAGELNAMAWYLQNAGGTTHPVATKQANAWGLHDMHGNVWEWCLDWYAPQLPGGSVTDPTGPSSGSSRVFRGGGWCFADAGCRSAVRDWSGPGFRGNILGFRPALSSVP